MCAELVSEGESKPLASQGGRLQRQELFISYSHKDRAFLEQFWIHLKPLETNYGLQRWDDSRIQPGDIWLEEIEGALERAQVALLLVSPNFLASEFIQRKELPSLFDAAKKDGLKILWLPIRPCSWNRYPQIKQYQSVGSVNPTLAEMDEVERDREMVTITDHIHDLFERIHREQVEALQAAEAKALAEREAEERRKAEQDAKRQAEETARLERLKAEYQARAEAEWWRAEAERLAREKKEWQRQIQSKTPEHIAQHKAPDVKGHPLIEIPTTRGWLVREGDTWRKKETPITVRGYRERLAERVALTLIQMPAGRFLMGSPEVEPQRRICEGPQHEVELRSFFMGQTPITQAEWKLVASWSKVEVEVELNPDPSKFKGLNRPVEQVTWEEAMEFCRRLSQKTRQQYTLPSEAQWEYACRAGTTSPFAFGEVLTTDMANYDGRYCYDSSPRGLYRMQTTEVASFPSNSWGLHDMHGNILEWCLDSWHETFEGAPTDGSAWIVNGEAGRPLRGGSWDDIPKSCRSSGRIRGIVVYRLHRCGFRICSTIPETESPPKFQSSGLFGGLFSSG